MGLHGGGLSSRQSARFEIFCAIALCVAALTVSFPCCPSPYINPSPSLSMPYHALSLQVEKDNPDLVKALKKSAKNNEVMLALANGE